MSSDSQVKYPSENGAIFATNSAAGFGSIPTKATRPAARIASIEDAAKAKAAAEQAMTAPLAARSLVAGIATEIAVFGLMPQ